MWKFVAFCPTTYAVTTIFLFACATQHAPLPKRVYLAEWRIASSELVGHDGETFSLGGFDDSDWLPARVPGTVAGAQYEAGLLGDALFGTNLMQLPGWTWSFLPMPEDSPYRAGWWWRTEAVVPNAPAGSRVWLRLEGVNYRANVFVNGMLAATKDEVVGALREHYLDLTSVVVPGQRAAFALEVFAPDVFRDLAIYFVDWNPEPPDYSAGLWMPVSLEVTGDVVIRDPAVLTMLLEDGSADLTVVATLKNAAYVPQRVTLVGRFEGHKFRYETTLGPQEEKEVAIGPTDVPALRLQRPKLWWPWRYGTPYLYEMELEAWVAGNVSDFAKFSFGVREIRAQLEPGNRLLFLVNRKPFQIRAAGWAPDIFLRHDPQKVKAELAYVKHLGLDGLRLEGKFKDHDFYALCDRLGIILIAGLCCCDAWENWKDWGPEHLPIAVASVKSQLRRLRGHASVIAWLNGSDFHPPPVVEQAYLDVAKAVYWDRPVISNATETPSEISGPSGMKMTGPYNWVPPSYWYLAVPSDPSDLEGRVDWEWMYGGAWGFNSESSPGYSVPPLDSLLRIMEVEDLWPPGGPTWLFHSGGPGSAPQRWWVYQKGLVATLGQPTSLENFVLKAQVLQYDAHRAMFEALARNKYDATGHVQWMLNNAWPGLIWQLYDYFLRPGGTYFGARKGLRPVHVLYAYDDRNVWVVNSTLTPLLGLEVQATLVALDGTIVAKRGASGLDLGADDKALAIPIATDIEAFPALAPVFFLDLRLFAQDGEELDRNFYWLSVAQDAYEWRPTKDNLPLVTPADLSGLNELPTVALDFPPPTLEYNEVSVKVSQTLRNPSAHVAFFVELLLTDKDGKPVLPIFWDDNYISLLPGEERTLNAVLVSYPLEGEALNMRISGWNIEPVLVKVSSTTAP